MRHAALAHLEAWLNEAKDRDPEQRAWKLPYAEGSVTAYERLGLLSPEEAARWRERFAAAEPDHWPETALDAELEASAERHLEALVESGTPEAEMVVVLDALHDVGALGADDHRRWWLRVTAAPAPAGWTSYAPVESGAFTVDSWVDEVPRGRGLRRVAIGSPERRGDTAIVALVVHDDDVSLHFHHLGPAVAIGPTRRSLDEFSDVVDSLRPPALRDDAGTTYTPQGDSPADASGSGGMPDVERRQAISGRWFYTPAAPAEARVFSAELDGSRWELRG
jgi:hypothetical protein